MALQYSVPVRNAQLDAWEAAIGAGPIIRMYDGVNPADCAAAAAGSKSSLNGPFTITGIAAAGSGTPVVAYRIYDSTGVTCHEQGTVTGIAGGGDLEMDNISIAYTQTANLNTITRTAGNA